MATKQLLSSADYIFAGRAYDLGLLNVQGFKGRRVSLLTKVDLGTPKLAVTNSLIKGATGSQLPNAATKTYTAATVGTAPQDSTDCPATVTIQTPADGSVTVIPLDVPRNITVAVTHDTSVVALTVTTTGYDKYFAKMTETLSITAGTTSRSATGAKAFAYIYSWAITSAGNCTTGNETLNVGFGSVLGLPFYLEEKADLLSVWFDDAVDSSTVVPGVTTSPATATTGDVRGTITIAGTLNGVKKLKAWMHVSQANAAARSTLLGVTQA